MGAPWISCCGSAVCLRRHAESQDLREARAALEVAGQGAQELREKEGMLSQQMASLKAALKDMSIEREVSLLGCVCRGRGRLGC